MLKKFSKKFKIANFRIVPFILLGLVSGIIICCVNNLLVATISLLIVAMFYLFLSLLTDIKKVILLLFVVAVFCGGLSINISYCIYQNKVAESVEDAHIIARVNGINFAFEDNCYQEQIEYIFVDNIILNGQKINGMGYVQNQEEQLRLTIGDEVIIEGDFIVSGLDYTDSYSIAKFNDGIYYTIVSDTMQKGMSYTPSGAEKVRTAIFDKLNDSLGAQIAGFCYSMLFGDKSYLYPNDKESFQISGTAHVFAVSGLHVGVLAGVIIWLLKKLKAKNSMVLIITTICLSVYAYFASFSPSVVRAGVMVTVMLMAKALGRRNDNLSTVCLTAGILLIIKPFWIFDVSFLLSFSAVFGIILMYPPLSKVFKKLRYFGNAIALNLSVNIGILPFILLFFGSFSCLTLPANLIIIPLISFVYILLLIHIICSFMLPFIVIFGAIIKPIIQFCLDFVAKIADVPNAIISASVPLALFLPYYLDILFLSDYCLIKKRYKIIVTSILVLAYFTVFIIFLYVITY